MDNFYGTESRILPLEDEEKSHFVRHPRLTFPLCESFIHSET